MTTLGPTQRWLQRARITDTIEGDLIEDMRRDPSVPRLFANRRIAPLRGFQERRL
jgi:hypothetical protein